MEFTNFDEVIDYAISREKEAVQFYEGLSDLVEFKERKRFILDLKRMEEKHIDILENVRAKGASGVTVPKVRNLKLSSTVVQPEPSENMSYQDILITGMKKEEASMELYSSLAENADDAEMKTVFQKLTGEENKHKNFFETLYDEEILTEN
jgi:rubrerythrin